MGPALAKFMKKKQAGVEDSSGVEPQAMSAKGGVKDAMKKYAAAPKMDVEKAKKFSKGFKGVF